jgi:hypothetical protein
MPAFTVVLAAEMRIKRITWDISRGGAAMVTVKMPRVAGHRTSWTTTNTSPTRLPGTPRRTIAGDDAETPPQRPGVAGKSLR